MKSYNKCSKNKIYDLTERIILLNAALTYVENEETLHETYLKEHITHKKNYLSYLKKNYDQGILTQDCQIYNQELIRPFFTKCSAQEELLVLENQVKYHIEIKKYIACIYVSGKDNKIFHLTFALDVLIWG